MCAYVYSCMTCMYIYRLRPAADPLCIKLFGTGEWTMLLDSDDVGSTMVETETTQSLLLLITGTVFCPCHSMRQSKGLQL